LATAPDKLLDLSVPFLQHQPQPPPHAVIPSASAADAQAVLEPLYDGIDGHEPRLHSQRRSVHPAHSGTCDCAVVSGYLVPPARVSAPRPHRGLLRQLCPHQRCPGGSPVLRLFPPLLRRHRGCGGGADGIEAENDSVLERVIPGRPQRGFRQGPCSELQTKLRPKRGVGAGAGPVLREAARGGGCAYSEDTAGDAEGRKGRKGCNGEKKKLECLNEAFTLFFRM
jgi:hypothetical protein